MAGMTQADTETPELELTASGDDAETHLLALRDAALGECPGC